MTSTSKASKTGQVSTSRPARRRSADATAAGAAISFVSSALASSRRKGTGNDRSRPIRGCYAGPRLSRSVLVVSLVIPPSAVTEIVPPGYSEGDVDPCGRQVPGILALRRAGHGLTDSADRLHKHVPYVATSGSGRRLGRRHQRDVNGVRIPLRATGADGEFGSDERHVEVQPAGGWTRPALTCLPHPSADGATCRKSGQRSVLRPSCWPP